MPSITYNLDIPNPPNNPSIDAPRIQVNTNSISTWNNVDHYTFSNNSAGWHKQVTFPANNAGGAQSGLESVLYTGPGTASAASSQMFYRNSLATLPVTLVRAYANINSNATIASSSNVASVTSGSTGQYTVTLTANATSSSSYAVIATSQQTSGTNLATNITAQVLSATQIFFVISKTDSSSTGLAANFSFVVLEL